MKTVLNVSPDLCQQAASFRQGIASPTETHGDTGDTGDISSLIKRGRTITRSCVWHSLIQLLDTFGMDISLGDAGRCGSDVNDLK